MKQKLIIKLGRSQKLAELVKSILPEEVGRHLYPSTITGKEDISFCTSNTASGPGYANSSWYREDGRFDDHKFIDAATQMGELVDLFEKKPVIVEKVAQDAHGVYYKANVSEDGMSAKIGCNTTTFSAVERLYLAMKEAQK